MPDPAVIARLRGPVAPLGRTWPVARRFGRRRVTKKAKPGRSFVLLRLGDHKPPRFWSTPRSSPSSCAPRRRLRPALARVAAAAEHLRLAEQLAAQRQGLHVVEREVARCVRRNAEAWTPGPVPRYVLGPVPLAPVAPLGSVACRVPCGLLEAAVARDAARAVGGRDSAAQARRDPHSRCPPVDIARDLHVVMGVHAAQPHAPDGVVTLARSVVGVARPVCQRQELTEGPCPRAVQGVVPAAVRRPGMVSAAATRAAGDDTTDRAELHP